MSDINGGFRILKPKKMGMTMSISFLGYETVKIENIDTISHPITITMKESICCIGCPNPNRIYLDFFSIIAV